MPDDSEQLVEPQAVTRDQIREKLLALLPPDGSAKGNITLIREIKNELGQFAEEDYWSVQRGGGKVGRSDVVFRLRLLAAWFRRPYVKVIFTPAYLSTFERALLKNSASQTLSCKTRPLREAAPLAGFGRGRTLYLWA